MEDKCPCCNEEVKVKIIPAKWQGEQDKVVIERKKWQENYK